VQAVALGRRLRSCSLSAAQRSYWERVGLIAWRLSLLASQHRAARRSTHAQTSSGGRTFPTLSGWQLSDTGKLDVLVDNAGVAPISLLDELRVDDWEEMIDVNLKGVLYGIATALPIFRRQGFGHFVNVISTAGMQIIPTMAVYAGTKNAVRTITETLRQEAGDKLRVTSISPGFVHTNLAASMTNPEVKFQISDRMEKDGDPAGGDCPRHCVCNRAAGRC